MHKYLFAQGLLIKFVYSFLPMFSGRNAVVAFIICRIISPNKQFVKLSYSPSSDSSVCAHLPEWLRIEAGNKVRYCRFVLRIIGKFLFCHGGTGTVQKKWMSVSVGKMDSCQSVNHKWPAL